MTQQIYFERLEPRTLFVAGGVDPYFGNNGGVTVLDSARNRSQTDLIVDATGNIITAVQSLGFSTQQEPNAFLHIRKFTSSGDPDPRFTAAGIDGEILIDDTPRGNVRLALSGDGGLFLSAGNRIMRLDAGGSPDTSFGDNGRIDVAGMTIHAIAALPDGKLLVTGSEPDVIEPDFVILRLNANGTADESFGSAGKREIPIANVFGPDHQPDRVAANGQRIVVLPNGSAYVVGTYTSTRIFQVHDILGNPETVADDRFGVIIVRLNPDGSFDTTFDADGIRQLGQDTAQPGQSAEVDVHTLEFLTTAAPGPGDTLQLVMESPPRATVFRLGLDGAVVQDPPPVYPSGSTQGLLGAIPYHDGKILLSKLRFPSNQTQYSLVRIRADGTDDPALPMHVPVDLGGGGTFEMRMARDGSTLVLADEQANDGSSKLVLRRLWRDDAPAAEVNAVNITSSSSRSQVLTVTYRDDESVATSSFDNRDLRITGPEGFFTYAKFDRIVSAKQANGWVRVRYKLAAPGGTWDAADNGTYSIRLRGQQIFDNDGNATDARTIGSFVVNVPVAQVQTGFAPKFIRQSDRNDELGLILP